MCGHVNGADMEPTPHHIEKGLYLGSRAFKINNKSLKMIGATHVIIQKGFRGLKNVHFCSILSGGTDRSLGDLHDVYDIEFLECDAQDTNNQNMHTLWDSAIRFVCTFTIIGTRKYVLTL